MSFPFIPYQRNEISLNQVADKSVEFYEFMAERRSVRDFSNRNVPREVIERLILTAATAPSGAHKQPWTFCVVRNKDLKTAIKQAAEEEERLSYDGRMSAEWLADLAPLGTDWHKPFIEIAPWVIVVFRKAYELKNDGSRGQTYYSHESVGIAVGFLLAAIHNAGLVALTHTPSPMNFMRTILNRPENERPFVLIPVGYPSANATVPDIHRKPLDQVAYFYD
ncbi:MAG: nitroreductase family protein [Ignavibacteria bacterium]|nr:nitroreductase family protein [Ignavibacteria bacterium]